MLGQGVLTQTLNPTLQTHRPSKIPEPQMSIRVGTPSVAGSTWSEPFIQHSLGRDRSASPRDPLAAPFC